MKKHIAEPDTDTLNYLDNVIRVALPKALIEPISNYDDFHFGYVGYDITPAAGILIQFRIEFNDSMRISVCKYQMSIYDKSVVSSNLFTGSLPPNQDMEPDFDFIIQLLRHYQNIGSR